MSELAAVRTCCLTVVGATLGRRLGFPACRNFPGHRKRNCIRARPNEFSRTSASEKLIFLYHDRDFVFYGIKVICFHSATELFDESTTAVSDRARVTKFFAIGMPGRE